MLRSMMSFSSLLDSLWGETLKTIVFLLNRVPNKAMNKTPYELWKGKMSDIRHLYVWSCPTETRPYMLYQAQIWYLNKNLSYNILTLQCRAWMCKCNLNKKYWKYNTRSLLDEGWSNIW